MKSIGFFYKCNWCRFRLIYYMECKTLSFYLTRYVSFVQRGVQKSEPSINLKMNSVWQMMSMQHIMYWLCGDFWLVFGRYLCLFDVSLQLASNVLGCDSVSDIIILSWALVFWSNLSTQHELLLQHMFFFFFFCDISSGSLMHSYVKVWHPLTRIGQITTTTKHLFWKIHWLKVTTGCH